MKTQQVKLTAEDIKRLKEQKQKYSELLEKELSFGDLTDWDKVYDWWEAYQHSVNLINDPYIEMPVFE